MSADVSGKGKTGSRAKKPGVSRTTEIARNRERRSFRIRLLAFTILILMILLAAVFQFWLRDSALVEVRDLEVIGVDTKTEEGRQIDQAIRTAVGEMTTLNVKPEVLDQELARYPRVADTSITTSFPDSATVRVTVRKDGSIMGEGAEAMLIATDGTVLGPAGGQESELPLLTLPNQGGEESVAAEKPAAGEKLTGRAQAQAIVLGATPPELRPFVERSRYSPNGLEVILDTDLVLLFHDASHAGQKWRAAATMIAEPEVESGSYVDLTVPRRPAVSSRESAYSDVEEATGAAPETTPSG